MEVWNETKEPLPFELGKQLKYKFLGVEMMPTKAGRSIERMLFSDNESLIIYWTPTFTIKLANIPASKMLEFTNKPVTITCLAKGYMLEFA